MKMRRILVSDKLICEMLEERLRDGKTFDSGDGYNTLVENGIPEDGRISFLCIGEGNFEFGVQSESFDECIHGELIPLMHVVFHTVPHKVPENT